MQCWITTNRSSYSSFEQARSGTTLLVQIPSSLAARISTTIASGTRASELSYESDVKNRS